MADLVPNPYLIQETFHFTYLDSCYPAILGRCAQLADLLYLQVFPWLWSIHSRLPSGWADRQLCMCIYPQILGWEFSHFKGGFVTPYVEAGLPFAFNLQDLSVTETSKAPGKACRNLWPQEEKIVDMDSLTWKNVICHISSLSNWISKGKTSKKTNVRTGFCLAPVLCRVCSRVHWSWLKKPVDLKRFGVIF